MKEPILLTDFAKVEEKLPNTFIPAEETIVEIYDSLLKQKKKVTFRRRKMVRDGKEYYYWVTFGMLAFEQKGVPPTEVTITQENLELLDKVELPKEETKPSGEGGGASPGNDDW